MILEELENLKQEQWFEALKGMCKSRVDLNLCIGVLLLVLVIIGLLSKLGHLDWLDIEFIAIGCVMGLLTLNNYRFRKRANSLSTPEQLLHTFEKTAKNNNKCWIAVALIITCKCIITTEVNGKYFWLTLAIQFIILAIGVFLYIKELINPRDKEIIKVLRELSEEEQGK